MRGLFVTATDTGVGKTIVSTLLVRGLIERGLPAIHFKPVQSGFITVGGREYPADLAFSRSLIEPEGNIAAYCEKRSLFAFRTPVSPDFAAEKEKKSIDPAAIVARANELAKEHLLITEGAGGAAVPLAPNYLMADLIADLGQKTLVVARPGLGTLNHTRLTVEFLRQRGVDIAGIVVSGYAPGEETADRNITQLPRLCNAPLIGILPRILGLDTERPGWLTPEAADALQERFDWPRIIAACGI
ncbi:MAG TPA: dethiobiotin synthase [bacterium]|nr:dethiobiotin synthase [bacterium]